MSASRRVRSGTTWSQRGELTASEVAHLPLRQRFIAGTTANIDSMGQRLRVEAVNSDLQGGFVDVDRGFCQLFTTKTRSCSSSRLRD